MGGSKQTQTTDQKTTGTTAGTATGTRDPWAQSQPLLNDVLTNARMYGGDTSMFTPTFGQNTQDAAAGIAQLGRNPLAQQGVLQGLIGGTQQGYTTGNNTLMQTASGGMLGANPYLDQVLATSGQRAADMVNSQFAGAGRYGSGAHTGVLADRLGAIETNARMGNYDTERSRQLNAAGLLSGQGLQGAQLSGQLDQANVQQQQLLAQGGAMQDAMANAQKQAPIAATNWMAGLGTPIAQLGGTTSQETSGTQSGTTNGTTVTQTPANIPGMIGGGIMSGLGLMAGNPMALSNIGSNIGGLFGGGAAVAAPQPSYYTPPQMNFMNGYF